MRKVTCDMSITNTLGTESLAKRKCLIVNWSSRKSDNNNIQKVMSVRKYEGIQTRKNIDSYRGGHNFFEHPHPGAGKFCYGTAIAHIFIDYYSNMY